MTCPHLHEALERLEREIDSSRAELVKLRYLAGLSIDDSR